MEVAGIDQKGNWATMGRPVQMANLFAKTRNFQSQGHPSDPAEALTWWGGVGLQGYTTRPGAVIANNVISGVGVNSPGSVAPTIEFNLATESDILGSAVRPDGMPNNYISVKRQSLTTPSDVAFSAISSSVPVQMGGNGGPNLPALPCFAVRLYKFRRGDDDLTPSATETCGACFWHPPRYTPHIAIQWGGHWELYIGFEETGDGGFGSPRRLVGIGKVFLTYYNQGKYWMISTDREGNPGWIIPAEVLSKSSWIDNEITVGICEIRGGVAVYFNDQFKNTYFTIPEERVPNYDTNDPTNQNLPVASMSASGNFDTPSTPLSIHGDNVSCQFAVQGVDFEAAGWVSERYVIYPRGADVEAASCRPLGYVAVGEPGASLTVAADDLPAEPGARPVKLITCTIQKQAGSACRASPFLSGYSIQQAGEWSDVVQTWVDISNGVIRISESSFEPSVLGTAEFVVDLDVALLDEFYPDWRDNVKMTVPIRIWVGWDDEIVPRLDGYVYGLSPTVAAYNEQSVRLICRDPMMRLQSPVGEIDFQYSPLDCYAVHLGRAAFGWEAVQGVMRTALGDTLADSLYVAWPTDHHDLYAALPFTEGASVASEGFFWAPKWGRESLYDWLSKVAIYDGSLLYIRPAKVAFAGEWTGEWTNVLFYVGINEFRKAEYEDVLWSTHYCYDALYDSAGVIQLGGSIAVEGETETQYNSHIKRVEAQWRLQEAINIVEVWVRDQKAPYPVGVFYKEDLDIGDPTAPNYIGWEQKLIYEITQPLPKLISQAIGTGLGNRFFGRRPVRATYKTLGQPDWWWGDRVIPSGDQIGIEEDVLRIWKLDSVLDCDALTYETNVTVIEEME